MQQAPFARTHGRETPGKACAANRLDCRLRGTQEPPFSTFFEAAGVEADAGVLFRRESKRASGEMFQRKEQLRIPRQQQSSIRAGKDCGENRFTGDGLRLQVEPQIQSAHHQGVLQKLLYPVL